MARDSWRGRAWAEAVLYELHVGTFTPEGTFAAAAARLPELAALGVNALQLMPLAAFPGVRNWGYDGVLPFAPAACYGTPDELKALVDAAHGAGIMVLLDVVYNHFGPDGNYLHAYCPEFFNPAARTPWGAAINFDGASSRTVRDYFFHNALYWMTEYCFDGLRLDAVHAFRDSSRPDIVCEIAQALREGPGWNGRTAIARAPRAREQSQRVALPRTRRGWPAALCHRPMGRRRPSRAALLISGEVDGYYADFTPDPLDRLGRALAEGFAYQGEHSAFRDKSRGEPSSHLPPDAFVGFLQNHDMVGNRAFGGRIDSFADARLLVAAYACLLLTPQVPMLFMGEEFAASTPFLFFCDFGPELARQSRQDGAGSSSASPHLPTRPRSRRFPIRTPRRRSTHRNCAGRSARNPPTARRSTLVRELLALRRQRLAAYLSELRHGGRYRIESGALHVAWDLEDGSACACWRTSAVKPWRPRKGPWAT